MKKIFFSLVMVLALVSCSTEELSNGGSTPASDEGSVQLVLSTDDMASRTVDENSIQDVNILEYVNGALATDEVVYLIGKDFSKPVEVLGLKELSATILDNGEMNEGSLQNFIFVIANYGKKIEDREAVATLDKLKEFKMDFSGKTTMSNLPMTGFYYGGINKTSTTMMNVSLQRAVAKVNFTVDTSNFTVDGTNPPSKVFINSIKLCNVPNKVTLYPCQDRPSLPVNGETGKWSGTTFPTTEEMENSVTYGDTENQSSDANTYVAYIPENARGSFTNITNNKDKHPSKCDGKITDEKADKAYTYILVDLDYVTADRASRNVTYRIYLGGNETGDMNLLRNTQYNVTTFLVGADPNSTDTRITVTDVYEPGTVENSEPAANCYMVNMSGTDKTLTIPLGQARRGWTRIAALTNKTTDFEAFKTALASGNFEVEQIWTTATGTVTGKLNTNKNYIDVTIPSTITNGNNAVIALKSKTDGKIYWSWHLWFTDYNPTVGSMQFAGAAFQTGGRYANKKMMDRDLGATITGVSKIEDQPQSDWGKYYGMFYQFGRKDPFLPADGTSAGNSKASVKVTGTAKTMVRNAVTLATAVQNPTVYYHNNSLFTDAPINSTDLWSANGVKSVFDPCPSGWRIPTGGSNAYYNPWAGFSNGKWDTVNNAWFNGDESATPFKWKGQVNGAAGSATNAVSSGRLYDYNNVKAWYPASGYLAYSGLIDLVGINGYSCIASIGNNLVFTTQSVLSLASEPSFLGFCVRCIQE